jgi:hypothetical protein
MAKPNPIPGNIPFQPGQSGNPNGAPKGKRVSTILKELLEDRVKDKEGKELTRSQKLALKLFTLSESDEDNSALRAIAEILDRTEGKSKQSIEVDTGPKTLTIIRKVIGGE